MDKDFIRNLVEESAREMYDVHGHISPWRLSREIHVSAEVIKGHLAELGYVEQNKGSFILKKDRDKATTKGAKPPKDIDVSSLKTFDERELPARDFIPGDNKGVDYTAFTSNELRSIATNRGIEWTLSMTKGELIRKIKSKLR